MHSLFHSMDFSPASLRGIHEWLARNLEPAAAVLAADPIGVIEHGDADALTPDQARICLNALRRLASDDPHFSAGARIR